MNASRIALGALVAARLADSGVVAKIRHALLESGLPPERLEFEFPETMLVSVMERAVPPLAPYVVSAST